MKNPKSLFLSIILGAVCVLGLTATADDKKPKPYTLDKCVVSDEKLGEMGKPFSFNYEGREVKLCCKNCKKDFDKEPAKFIKKIETAEAAAKPQK
jgi:YHS domain-containing protein